MTRSPVYDSTILVLAVFSTKDQAEFITPEIEPLLYDRISKILFDQCYSPALAVGGGPEHVHILIALARNWAPLNLIETVKTKSRDYIRKWSPEFEWQEGCAIVTVSRSEDEIEMDYIERQKEIHKNISFKDEYRQFLESNGMEYEEEGLWD